LTNRTLKTPNGQLNKNVKFDVFGHLKKMEGIKNKKEEEEKKHVMA
jgi:hypothetical protein